MLPVPKDLAPHSGDTDIGTTMLSMTPHQQEVPRSAAVVLLGGVALIHIVELQDKLHEVPYLGVGYILVIAASLLGAALLIRTDSRLGWLLGGGAALVTLIGYCLTRTVGLPRSRGDIGNWLEPMGLASIFVEGALVTLVAAVLHPARIAAPPRALEAATGS